MISRIVSLAVTLLTALSICLSQCRPAMAQERSAFEGERIWKCAEQMMYTGFNSFEKIVVADFSGDRLDAVRHVLRKSQNIEVLVVGGKYFSDSAFQEIEALKSLKLLILDSVNVDDESLKKLQTTCANLIVFRSEKTAVEELLSDFHNPRFDFEVDRSAPQLIKTFGEKHFRSHTTFDFSFDTEGGQKNPLASETLIYLKRLKNLQRLDLSYAQVDDDSLKYLYHHAQLKRLVIPFNYVSTESVEQLYSELDLTELILTVTDCYLKEEMDAKIASIRVKLPEVTIIDYREQIQDR